MMVSKIKTIYKVDFFVLPYTVLIVLPFTPAGCKELYVLGDGTVLTWKLPESLIHHAKESSKEHMHGNCYMIENTSILC